MTTSNHNSKIRLPLDAEVVIIIMKNSGAENREKYKTLKDSFLNEAEELFGPKTEYIDAGITYHNAPPKTILSEEHLLDGEIAFRIVLNGQGSEDIKDGIFQLSHEVVHMLSPVQQDDGDEVNFLEEGMATYFSKVVTERETGDYEFCDKAIERHSAYLAAYKLYLELHSLDVDAVKKLRKITPIIANIQKEDFQVAGIDAKDELIDALLAKF